MSDSTLRDCKWIWKHALGFSIFNQFLPEDSTSHAAREVGHPLFNWSCMNFRPGSFKTGHVEVAEPSWGEGCWTESSTGRRVWCKASTGKRLVGKSREAKG